MACIAAGAGVGPTSSALAYRVVVLLFACYGGGGASFRPRGGEAWRAVDPPRHRGEAGRDRAVALVAPALRDRDRARRVRQDDAAGGVGRGGSASLRVDRPGRTGRRRRRAPALHRGGDASGRAGRARGVRRPGRPGGVDLVDRCPARRERAGEAPASAGAGARRPARCRGPVLPRRAGRVVRVRSFRVTDRRREQGGAGPAPGPLADAGVAARDRRGRPAARRARGTRAVAQPRASSSTRPRSPI